MAKPDKIKVIVAGSRSIRDKNTVMEAINESPHTPFHGELVSGGAQGVDAKAKEIANHFKHIEYREFEAEWNNYGSAAGPMRNDRMAEYADALIAVWDGESNGTRDMIEKALERGLDIYVKVEEVEKTPQGAPL